MFIDENMMPGNNYYRLTQYDFDGKSETFDAIVLNAESGAPRISVSPNPAMDMVTVTVPSSSSAAEITIMDVAGKTLMTQEVNASRDNASIQLDLTSLPEGLYYIRYGNSTDGFTTQMIQLL